MHSTEMCEILRDIETDVYKRQDLPDSADAYYTVYNYDRAPVLVLILAVFAAAVVAIGGVELAGRTYKTVGMWWTEYYGEMPTGGWLSIRISGVDIDPGTEGDTIPVSYTHLDVYKRQGKVHDLGILGRGHRVAAIGVALDAVGLMEGAGKVIAVQVLSLIHI